MNELPIVKYQQNIKNDVYSKSVKPVLLICVNLVIESINKQQQKQLLIQSTQTKSQYLFIDLMATTDKKDSGSYNLNRNRALFLHQFLKLKFIQYNNISKFNKQMPRTQTQESNISNNKRSYARISLKRRKMLINMVTKQGYSIAKAIKKLNLKLTTARFILQKYRENGTFPMKKFKGCTRMLKDLPDKKNNDEPSSNNNFQNSSLSSMQLENNDQKNHVILTPIDAMIPLVWFYYWP